MKHKFLVSVTTTNIFKTDDITDEVLREIIQEGLEKRGLSEVSWHPTDGMVGDYDALIVENIGK